MSLRARECGSDKKNPNSNNITHYFAFFPRRSVSQFAQNCFAVCPVGNWISVKLRKFILQPDKHQQSVQAGKTSSHGVAHKVGEIRAFQPWVIISEFQRLRIHVFIVVLRSPKLSFVLPAVVLPPNMCITIINILASFEKRLSWLAPERQAHSHAPAPPVWRETPASSALVLAAHTPGHHAHHQPTLG